MTKYPRLPSVDFQLFFGSPSTRQAPVKRDWVTYSIQYGQFYSLIVFLDIKYFLKERM